MTVRDPSPARDRVNVLGCEIDRLDRGQTLAACAAAIEERRFTQHMAINAAKIVALTKDSDLQRIVEGCELVSADGQAVVWASRLLGDRLPERVAGIDLMQALLELAEARGYRVYILGAQPAVLERAVAVIRRRHPALVLAGHRDGYFPDEQADAVAADIAVSRPDILFVAMSSPRKEYFLGEFGRRVGASLVMGVGGSVDVLAGVTRRAPALMQRAGLEWLFRLAQEPRRMLRRYAVTNMRFLWMLARARAHVRRPLCRAVTRG